MQDEQNANFSRLLTIMDELREKCPWDKKQTLESLSYLTIEETYELIDAILENNMDDIKGELGDLLLHIVYYTVILCIGLIFLNYLLNQSPYHYIFGFD